MIGNASKQLLAARPLHKKVGLSQGDGGIGQRLAPGYGAGGTIAGRAIAQVPPLCMLHRGHLDTSRAYVLITRPALHAALMPTSAELVRLQMC